MNHVISHSHTSHVDKAGVKTNFEGLLRLSALSTPAIDLIIKRRIRDS